MFTFSLVTFVFILAGVPIVALLILGPANRAAGQLNAPTRFQLTDFLWLFLLLQGSLSYCVQGIGTDLKGAFVAALLFLWTASIAIWALAISFLSRAGVSSALRRSCFILLQLPGTLAMMIGVPMLAAVGLQRASIYMYHVFDGRRAFDVPTVAAATIFGLGGLLLFVCLGWLLRLLSAWIVAEQPAIAASKDGAAVPASSLPPRAPAPDRA